MKFPQVLFILFLVGSNCLCSCNKLDISPTPVIYGHAGTALSPEREVFRRNTEASILYALDVLNADGVEVDIQMSKDSVLFVYHEDFLDDFTTAKGCLNDFKSSDIETLKYFQNDRILRLDEVISIVLSRNKKLFLDAKHHNACSNSYVDFTAFNDAFNSTILSLSNDQKEKITFNCRNIGLINSITDTIVSKSFENDDVSAGLAYFIDGKIDKIGIKLGSLNTEKVKVLEENSIPFMIFGVKSKKEIKACAKFKPDEIITDNIAATRKYYN